MSEAVIEAAIAEYRDSEPTMDSLGNTVVSMDSGMGDEDASSAAPTVDAADDTAPVAPDMPEGTPNGAEAAAQDEIDKLLAKEGITPLGKGRENRIPYSRTKKIIENAQKEWQKQAEEKFGVERQSFTEVQTRVQNYERQEQVASQDPDRYISLLASVDPRYQKFLSAVGKSGEPAKPAADTDPEPQPLMDRDGNPYYTPEGWKDHQAWIRRQAARDAEAALEKKYGTTLRTVQDREQARATLEAQRPVVEKQTARLVDVYGAELVSKNQDAIIAEMEKARQANAPLSLAEAAAKVLLPLIRQDEAAIRSKVIDELNKRPAAARGSAPAQKRAAVSDTPLTGEDLIRAELDRVLPNRNRG